MLTSLVLILVLIVCSGFFSGSETALTAASRPMMHELERQGQRSAGIVNRLLDKRDRLIGAILLGNNLVNILASTLAAGVAIQLAGETGVAYATVVMTLLILVFAEIMPKTYAIYHADRMALAVAPVIRPLVFLLAPVTHALDAVVRACLRTVGVQLKSDTRGMAQRLAELRGAIELHRDAAADEVHHERAMLRSILDLNDVSVGEIMTHRKSVVLIDADQPAAEIVNQVMASPYTRIPLYSGSSDTIVGVLHAKNLLRAVSAAGGDLSEIDIQGRCSRPWFIPETTTLLDQLQAFRQYHAHFALVVDEYGSLEGVVTLEDILEEIVGEIADEHDAPVTGVRPQADGSLVVDGSVTLRDLNRQYEWDLPDEEASTVAGLLLHEAREIPRPGQKYRFYGFRFDVLRRHRNQITQVQIHPPRTEASENDGEGSG